MTTCACRCTPGPFVPIPGPPGPPGPPGLSGPGGGCCTTQAVTAHALGGHRLVVPLDDGTVTYADATDPDHANRPLWLTTSAWGPGVVADLTVSGDVTEFSWTWTPGVPLLVGTGGQLVHVVPPGAVFSRRAGLPIDSSTIWFTPGQPIVLAP